MCLCPAHDDNSPSLSIRVGTTSLLFKCFAGCEAIGVIRAIRRRGLLKAGALPVSDCSSMPPPASDWTRRRARELWEQSHPITDSTGERYLLGRCLLPPFPDLRFHPRTPLGKGRSAVFRPALLAAVRDRSGLVAIQRTFLDPVTADKAGDLPDPRLMLGRPGKGAVRLAPASGSLGLSEGVESGLAAMQIHQIPVWALLGNEPFGSVELPDQVTHLVILADNDPAGHRAARIAMDAHSKPGRIVEVRWPPSPLSDWNDVLRQGGEGAGSRVRLVA